MAFINPERTQYKEAAVWVGCSFKGQEGQICLPIWVDNDFSMARGWMMGFYKKLGQIDITDYNPQNPVMPTEGWWRDLAQSSKALSPPTGKG